MPRSCNLVFDLLRFGLCPVDGTLKVSLRDLAEECRLSVTQTRRALRRLEAVRLLRWHRTRGRCGVVELHWQSFPQKTVPPTPLYAREYLDPRERRKLCFAKTSRSAQLPNPSTRAHRWAMHQLRHELTAGGYPTQTTAERERLLDAAGAQLWRGLATGRLQPGESLALAVDELRAGFADLWRIGTARQLHAMAGASVRAATAVFDAECTETAEAEAQLAEFDRQRAEAAMDSLEEWLHREGVASVAEYVRRLRSGVDD